MFCIEDLFWNFCFSAFYMQTTFGNELWVERMTEQGQVRARALFTSTGVDAGRGFGPPVILALQGQKDKGSPQ